MQLHEAETGQSVVVDEDIKYKDIYDTTQSSSFARRLSVNLVEIAQTVSSLEDALSEKATVPPPRRQSLTSGAFEDTSSDSASPVQKRLVPVSCSLCTASHTVPCKSHSLCVFLAVLSRIPVQQPPYSPPRLQEPAAEQD